jgi:hypothetical protein
MAFGCVLGDCTNQTMNSGLFFSSCFFVFGGKFSPFGYNKQFTATLTNYLCEKNVPESSDFNDKISVIAIVRNTVFQQVAKI